MVHDKKRTDLTIKTITNFVESSLDSCIIRLQKARDRTDINRTLGEFGGFWKTIYADCVSNFGEKEARKFQEKLLIYHNQKTRDLTGNAAYARVLNQHIGGGLSKDEYDLIIKKSEVSELEQKVSK